MIVRIGRVVRICKDKRNECLELVDIARLLEIVMGQGRGTSHVVEGLKITGVSFRLLPPRHPCNVMYTMHYVIYCIPCDHISYIGPKQYC